jgi:hypothetical protein
MGSASHTCQQRLAIAERHGFGVVGD